MICAAVNVRQEFESDFLNSSEYDAETDKLSYSH